MTITEYYTVVSHGTYRYLLGNGSPDEASVITEAKAALKRAQMNWLSKRGKQRGAKPIISVVKVVQVLS